MKPVVRRNSCKTSVKSLQNSYRQVLKRATIPQTEIDLFSHFNTVFFHVCQVRQLVSFVTAPSSTPSNTRFPFSINNKIPRPSQCRKILWPFQMRQLWFQAIFSQLHCLYDVYKHLLSKQTTGKFPDISLTSPTITQSYRYTEQVDSTVTDSEKDNATSDKVPGHFPDLPHNYPVVQVHRTGRQHGDRQWEGQRYQW